MKLSVVIPVYNEQDNVATLHKEVVAVLKKIRGKHEIIFVDDCSTDNTVHVLRTLKPVTVLSFGRNVGQAAALKAGFDHASGEIIISMDGDLQNDPADIPKLLAKLQEGYDSVSGWRVNRKDNVLKRLYGPLWYQARQMLIADGAHDPGCTLKVYKAWCVKNMELFGQMHRFIPAILKLRGAQITELPVNHRARVAGTSKYNFLKAIPGILDLLLMWFWQKFAMRPIHILGFLGGGLSLFGFVMGCWAIYLKLRYMTDLSSTFLPNIAVFSVAIGLQLFVTGLLADIMIKNYYRDNPPYHVREVIQR